MDLLAHRAKPVPCRRMNTDLCALSATQLLDAYRKHELSRVHVTRAVLERLERLDPELTALNLVSGHALDDEKVSEARWLAGQPKGLLDGVPVSIKDIILTMVWLPPPLSK